MGAVCGFGGRGREGRQADRQAASLGTVAPALLGMQTSSPGSPGTPRHPLHPESTLCTHLGDVKVGAVVVLRDWGLPMEALGGQLPPEGGGVCQAGAVHLLVLLPALDVRPLQGLAVLPRGSGGGGGVGNLRRCGASAVAAFVSRRG